MIGVDVLNKQYHGYWETYDLLVYFYSLTKQTDDFAQSRHGYLQGGKGVLKRDRTLDICGLGTVNGP